jgi:hypothetical protein
MPPLTKAHGEDPRGPGVPGVDDTTHAQGEEDPGTTTAAGEEDETSGEPTDNPFGSF